MNYKHRALRVALAAAGLALLLPGRSPAMAPFVPYDPDVVTVNASGTLAYYRLNDTTNVLHDSSGHNLNGVYGPAVMRNAPAITAYGDRTSAFTGGAYDTSHFAHAPINDILQPRAVTVEAWIKQSATSYGRSAPVPIVAYGKNSVGASYALRVSTRNNLEFYVHTTSGTIVLDGYSNLYPGTTYHAAGTYDGRTASLYLNGILQNSVSYSGTIAYQYLTSSDGLSIGSAIDKGAPVFAGNISQAAVYGSALPASTVQAHYVRGVAPEVLSERANPANLFVDSIGVNTHLHFTSTLYDTQFAKIKAWLVDLGIRHIRDGLVDSSQASYYQKLNEFGAVGIKSTLVTSFGQSASLIAGYPARIRSTFEAYEAPNEPDVHPVGDWVANTRAFQRMLYNTVKGNASTKNYPVLGPTATNLQDFIKLGSLSPYMDLANFHQYTPGFNPGNDGYGSVSVYGTNGSLDWGLATAHIVGGNHQPVITETGFNYAPGGYKGHVPTDVGARYVPRFFLETFNRGVARTFLYQLIDFEGSPSFQDGLIAQDLKPKAPYYALRSLIRLINDPGAKARSSIVNYTLKGNLASVHHTLLERGDGTFDLVLWVEARSLVPTIQSGAWIRIAVPEQQVTVVMPSAVRAVAATHIDSSGNMVATPTSRSGSSITLGVADEATVVHIAL